MPRTIRTRTRARARRAPVRAPETPNKTNEEIFEGLSKKNKRKQRRELGIGL